MYGITYEEMQQEINVKEQLIGKLSNTLEGMKKQRAIRMASNKQNKIVGMDEYQGQIDASDVDDDAS